MPLDERKLRMNQLKKRERRMDVDSWVESFLVGMEDISQGELQDNVFYTRYDIIMLNKGCKNGPLYCRQNVLIRMFCFGFARQHKLLETLCIIAYITWESYWEPGIPMAICC